MKRRQFTPLLMFAICACVLPLKLIAAEEEYRVIVSTYQGEDKQTVRACRKYTVVEKNHVDGTNRTKKIVSPSISAVECPPDRSIRSISVSNAPNGDCAASVRLFQANGQKSELRCSRNNRQLVIVQRF